MEKNERKKNSCPFSPPATHFFCIIIPFPYFSISASVLFLTHSTFSYHSTSFRIIFPPSVSPLLLLLSIAFFAMPWHEVEKIILLPIFHSFPHSMPLYSFLCVYFKQKAKHVGRCRRDITNRKQQQHRKKKFQALVWVEGWKTHFCVL